MFQHFDGLRELCHGYICIMYTFRDDVPVNDNNYVCTAAVRRCDENNRSTKNLLEFN